MNVSKKSLTALSVIVCAVTVMFMNVIPGKSSPALEDTTGMQDVMSLDRRISLLEQRLISIESNISRLQQVALSTRSPTSTSSVRDQEIDLIRENVRNLSLRLDEVECGLLKLDERTTISAGNTRKSTGAKPNDPCRLNPDTPLRLTTRP
jgi:hypothetical protein